jgi:hypothetical protein
MAGGNGKVTGTAKRLLALEVGQREVKAELVAINTRLEGMDAHLAVMTEHLERQGATLIAIKDLLAEALPLRVADPAELIRLFWTEGRLALSLLAGRSG